MKTKSRSISINNNANRVASSALLKLNERLKKVWVNVNLCHNIIDFDILSEIIVRYPKKKAERVLIKKHQLFATKCISLFNKPMKTTNKIKKKFYFNSSRQWSENQTWKRKMLSEAVKRSAVAENAVGWNEVSLTIQFESIKQKSLRQAAKKWIRFWSAAATVCRWWCASFPKVCMFGYGDRIINQVGCR